MQRASKQKKQLMMIKQTNEWQTERLTVDNEWHVGAAVSVHSMERCAILGTTAFSLNTHSCKNQTHRCFLSNKNKHKF